MSNNRYNIVDKGFYSRPQSNECIFVKQYIIAKEDTKKFLLLRFWNTADFVINGMEFVITQIGADKHVIDTSVVKIEGMRVSPGGTYTTNNGIVISEECVDFKVFVKYVSSGAYEYYDRGGKTVPKYNPQPNENKRLREYGRSFISKPNVFSSKFSALVAVLLILAVVGISAYFSAQIL